MTETGWTHEEAKQHTLVERLLERCAVSSPRGKPCMDIFDPLPFDDYCQRCLAANHIMLTALDAPTVTPDRPSAKEQP